MGRPMRLPPHNIYILLIQIKLAIPSGPELVSQLEEHGLSVMESCLRSRDEFHVILEVRVPIPI